MTLKEIFITISTIIDDKLKTPSGKLTLVILNCIILGGATVHSWNVSTNLNVAVIDRDIYKRKEDSIQTVLNSYIATENQRCNDNLEKGALLQQRMRDIYNQKEQDNYKVIEENEKVLKAREATAKAKLENIKALTTLKNQD